MENEFKMSNVIQRNTVSKMMLIVAALLSLLALTSASVGAQVHTNYTAKFSVQNLSSSSATVVVEYFSRATGLSVATASDTIAGDSEVFYFAIGAVTAGFDGSAVVSSNQPVASVVYMEATSSDADTISGAYAAVNNPGTSFLVPQLFANHFGYTSWIQVQNAGAADATVTVAYSDGVNVGPVTIQKGATARFQQADASHTATELSATVTSTNGEPIAVVAVQERAASGKNQLRMYNGVANTDTVFYFPNVMENWFNNKTTISIQNAGATATDVTVSYLPADGNQAACTETQTLAAGEAKPFGVRVMNAGVTPIAGTATDCVNGLSFIGSAFISANSASQQLAAVVANVNPRGAGDLYNAFTLSTATDKIAFPMVMDRYNSSRSTLRIMNLSGSSTTINCVFSGTSYTSSTVLASNEVMIDVHKNAIANGHTGSGTCTSSNGAKIVGVGALGVTGASYDSLRLYNAFNQ